MVIPRATTTLSAGRDAARQPAPAHGGKEVEITPSSIFWRENIDDERCSRILVEPLNLPFESQSRIKKVCMAGTMLAHPNSRSSFSH